MNATTKNNNQTLPVIENTSDIQMINFLNEKIAALEIKCANAQYISNSARTELRTQTDTIKEFVHEHVKENKTASVQQLKDLAEELEIEMTKIVTVRFNIEVEFDIELDINEEVGESEFNFDVSYTGKGDVYNESTVIDDYEVEEN